MSSAFGTMRVLDGAQGHAGQMAAMLLGDFGAEVLRIEPSGGDPATGEPGHVVWNRNKHRVVLDLTSPDDREQIDALIAGADVLVLDHQPRELARLGLDPAKLVAANRRLVCLWTPPYGAAGRWSDLPAHQASLAGLTGAAHRQSSYADQPIWYVAPIIHSAQAVLAAAAAGAALLARSSTGRGQTVTVSGLHAMAQTSCPVQVGEAPPPPPQRTPIGPAPRYRLYKCADGRWLFLAALHAHFFRRALQALELAEADESDVGAAIEARIAQAPCEHWLALFRAHDVPAAPVGRREDWLKSDIIRANDLSVALEHTSLGPVLMPGVGANLAATPGSVRHFARVATPQQISAFAERREPARARTSERFAPLAGVRVLDLGTVVAGPCAGVILANFGADVIKVESAEGDPTRFAAAGIGAFINFNRGKRALGLNLKDAAGRELFLDLARKTDVVMDNFRMGVRERLGIDYPALRAVNPRIISCSMNAYGTRGEAAPLPGFDPLLQAQSGMMSAQGGEGGEPVFHTIAVNDVATAALSSFAIIAALNARETMGEGQNVEVSLAGASTVYQLEALTTYAGRRPGQVGARDCVGFAALDRYYACRDGWLTLACTSAAHYRALVETLGRAAWRTRWEGAAALAEAPDGPLAAEIAAALAERRRDEVIDALFEAGVPAAPVLRTDEIRQSDFLWTNGYYERHVHPTIGEVVASRGFAEFDGAPARFHHLHPQLGEHSEEILLECGISPERIRQLVGKGIVFSAEAPASA